MENTPPGVVPQEPGSDVLERRIAYLEGLTSFHDEVVKIIRANASDPSLTPERCLKEVTAFIARRFNISMACILLLDELSRELVLYVGAGDDTLEGAMKTFRVPLGSGISGCSAKEGEVLVVDDVATDPRFIRGPLPQTRSEMAVPIRIRQRIVGVLDLQDRSHGRFTSDFAHLMDDVALDIGFVLETRQLHDDLKGTNERLEKRLDQGVLDLRKSEERYRNIVENSADSIFMADLDGRFTWVNRAACSHLGYLRTEMQGMNIARLMKKGNLHKLFVALRDVREGREVRPLQIEVLTKDGDERTVEFACTALREEGRTVGLEGAFRDITDRVVIEKLKKNYTKSLEEAVAERTSEIKETQRAAILAIANLAESIDDDTGGHLERIRHYCKILSEELRATSKYRDQITGEYSELIYDLSPLHDLGKVGIRDYILQKPDKLTSEEFEKMKEHAEIGARALRMAGEMIHRESIFSIGEMIAHFHHEKWDGTGYPAVPINGETRPLRGEEIPLCARIVALADVYDALTSKRPYKMPFPHETARDMIVAQAGKHFDPEVVEAFLRVEPQFMGIRKRFPDTEIPDGRPFELPARDR